MFALEGLFFGPGRDYFLRVFASLRQSVASGEVQKQSLLSSDDVFQETSARYRAVEPEQWLQRHPEAGSSSPL